MTLRSILIACFLSIAAANAHAELPSASVSAVNEALSAGKPAVIDLGARFCVPCRMMAPVLEALASEYRGRASVLFIDVNKDHAAGERFRIRMIPTQIFFDAHGKEIKRHVGFMDKAAILKELRALGVK